MTSNDHLLARSNEGSLAEVMATPPASSTPPRIQSVARAVRVLEAIAASPGGLTASEISTVVELNRATAYHLLHTLASVGYVVSGSGRRYRLAMGLGVLVAGFERQVLPQDFTPMARALAARTGETAYVAARQGARLVLLCSVPGHHAVGVAMSPPGPILEGHARASGKLLLALAPGAVRDEYLAANPLQKLTSSTVVDARALEAEFEGIRERNYATDESEYYVGVSCIAVPAAGGSTALVLSAPHERFVEHFEEYLAAAQAASLGHDVS